MKIEYMINQNILKSKSTAIVNPVNTVGVMGKGLALQFKQAYPLMYESYKAACYANTLTVGHMHYYKDKNKIIINFPTKINWRDPSDIEYIQKGLISLIKAINKLNIKSIAIPPLGCGNGKLNWQEVHALIINTLVPEFKNTNLVLQIYCSKTQYGEVNQ